MRRMVIFTALLGLALAAPQQLSFGQDRLGSIGGGQVLQQPTTPAPVVPIIRHINRVNEDGSYTFGYEGGDGNYRVETRGVDGITRGKYGYIDEQGQRKEVDYVAGSDTGYEPSGQGITVPPRPPPNSYRQDQDPYAAGYDDGSYRPEYQTERPRAARPAGRPVAASVPHQPQFVSQAQVPQAPTRSFVPPPPQPQFVAPPPPPQAQPHFSRAPQVISQHPPTAFIPAQHSAPASVHAIHDSQFAQPRPLSVAAAPAGNPSPIDAFLQQHLRVG